MKQKLSVLLALCFCVSMLCCSALADVTNANDVSTGTLSDVGAFPDVPATAPYAEAVNTLHEYGIINGDNKGNFNPNSPVTRAEAAAMICRLLGMEEDAKRLSTDAFKDVPVNHWANGYIAKAAEQKIIGGYGNGKFGPNDPVTYLQLAKMLVCVWGYDNDANAIPARWSFYGTVDEYDAEYEEIVQERERLRTEYQEAVTVYQEKVFRDNLRKKLAESMTESNISLCFFNGSEETVVTDGLVWDYDCGYGGDIYFEDQIAIDVPVLVYEGKRQF